MPTASREAASTGSSGSRTPMELDEAPTSVVSIAKEKILEEVLKREKEEKPVLSLVVVGESFCSAKKEKALTLSYGLQGMLMLESQL